MKEKHIPYFELMDSLSEKVCPVCYLVRNKVERYFSNLLYENVNDVPFRKRFRENKGFCKYHSYQFLSYNDGLAISLTHRDIISDVIEEIRKKEFKYFSRRKKSKCIVCEFSGEMEENYISAIIDYLDDVQFRTKFVTSQGLCVPHYKILFEMNKKLPTWIKEYHINKYTDLLYRLDKFIDSCNYTNKDKQPSTNNDREIIWKEVITVLFGYKNITTEK